jgi:hypothetical protein
MARLFITPREIDFINDIAKEVMKDVNAQKIYYYSIDRERSRIHDVYDEAIDKIFDHPLEIPAFVDWQESEVRANEFGTEQIRSINVYISSRDLIQKGIDVKEGDFLSYGTQFFEIVRSTTSRSIYGQVEYADGINLVCREARQGAFITKVLGPKGEEYSDDDAIQETFVQERGYENNSQGPTGDVRDLQRRGVLDKPISEPREISPRGDDKNTSAFYDED